MSLASAQRDNYVCPQPRSTKAVFNTPNLQQLGPLTDFTEPHDTTLLSLQFPKYRSHAPSGSHKPFTQEPVTRGRQNAVPWSFQGNSQKWPLQTYGITQAFALTATQLLAFYFLICLLAFYYRNVCFAASSGSRWRVPHVSYSFPLMWGCSVPALPSEKRAQP